MELFLVPVVIGMLLAGVAMMAVVVSGRHLSDGEILGALLAGIGLAATVALVLDGLFGWGRP